MGTNLKDIKEPFYYQVCSEISKVDKKEDTYTWLFYCFRIVQVLLGAAITIISGIKNAKSYYIFSIKLHETDVILVLGATVTTFAGIDSLFNVSAKKSIYEQIKFDLKALRSKIAFYCLNPNNSGGRLNEDERKECFNEFAKIMERGKGLFGKDEKEPKPEPER